MKSSKARRLTLASSTAGRAAKRAPELQTGWPHQADADLRRH